MPNHEFKRALEEVRELCSLRMSEAKGLRDFHSREAYRLPNGKKREEHAIEGHAADMLTRAYAEIIERIDLHLPKAQLAIVTEATIEQYDFWYPGLVYSESLKKYVKEPTPAVTFDDPHSQAMLKAAEETLENHGETPTTTTEE